MMVDAVNHCVCEKGEVIDKSGLPGCLVPKSLERLSTPFMFHLALPTIINLLGHQSTHGLFLGYSIDVDIPDLLGDLVPLAADINNTGQSRNRQQ